MGLTTLKYWQGCNKPVDWAHPDGIYHAETFGGVYISVLGPRLEPTETASVLGSLIIIPLGLTMDKLHSTRVIHNIKKGAAYRN